MYNFKAIEKAFVRKVLPIECVSRGILPSEGFAFCALCKKYNIDMIIESGIYNGQSTLIWARFFKGIPIVSIDKILKPAIIEKFKLFGDVIFIQGDGRELLRYLVKVNSAKRIAVFIDGPKGETAISLAGACFESKNVFIAAMHDTHKISFEKPNKTRTIIDTISEFTFHTDNKEFVNQYSYMDEAQNLCGIGDEDVHWRPGILKTASTQSFRKLGSYGPTISFMLKDL